MNNHDPLNTFFFDHVPICMDLVVPPKNHPTSKQHLKITEGRTSNSTVWWHNSDIPAHNIFFRTWGSESITKNFRWSLSHIFFINDGSKIWKIVSFYHCILIFWRLPWRSVLLGPKSQITGSILNLKNIRKHLLFDCVLPKAATEHKTRDIVHFLTYFTIHCFANALAIQNDRKWAILC